MLLCTVSMVFLLQSKALCPSAQQQQAEKVTLGLYLALYPAKFSSCPCMGSMLYMIFPMVSMVSSMDSSIVAGVFHGIFMVYMLFCMVSMRLFMVFPMGLFYEAFHGISHGPCGMSYFLHHISQQYGFNFPVL